MKKGKGKRAWEMAVWAALAALAIILLYLWWTKKQKEKAITPLDAARKLRDMAMLAGKPDVAKALTDQINDAEGHDTKEIITILLAAAALGAAGGWLGGEFGGPLGLAAGASAGAATGAFLGHMYVDFMDQSALAESMTGLLGFEAPPPTEPGDLDVPGGS